MSGIYVADLRPDPPKQQTFHIIMVIVFSVGLCVFLLLIFVRCRSNQLLASWGRRPSPHHRVARRRGRLDFTGQEPVSANRSIGLDKSIIDSLPVFSYKIPSSEEDPLLQCAVCLCEFQEDEKGRLLPSCKHSFHTECIDMWFRSNTTCPLCRTVVTITSEENLSKTSEQSRAARAVRVKPSLPGSHMHSLHNDSMLPPTSPYPNSILFWGDHNHVSSQLSSPGIATGGSSSTRSLLQISIETPRREEDVASRCLSLSLSRCPSVDIDEACSSQPLKSPTIHMSIKRLLSREWSRGRTRVPPSTGQEHGEHNEEAAVISTSNKLCEVKLPEEGLVDCEQHVGCIFNLE